MHKHKEHYFKVINVKVDRSDKDLLRILAKETGYWWSRFDNIKKSNIGELVGLGVCEITDEDKIREINKQSGWH